MLLYRTRSLNIHYETASGIKVVRRHPISMLNPDVEARTKKKNIDVFSIPEAPDKIISLLRRHRNVDLLP